jgi:hypothetical protein
MEEFRNYGSKFLLVSQLGRLKQLLGLILSNFFVCKECPQHAEVFAQGIPYKPSLQFLFKMKVSKLLKTQTLFLN